MDGMDGRYIIRIDDDLTPIALIYQKVTAICSVTVNFEIKFHEIYHTIDTRQTITMTSFFYK